MPNEEQALAVLDALAQSPEGLSITALEARVQLRRSTLELLLKVLDVEGAAVEGRQLLAPNFFAVAVR